MAKSEDKSEPDIIIKEDVDPRVHLMYGVPFPDGSIARPVDLEENSVPSPRNGSKTKGAKLPNGGVAYPVDDEVKERVETSSKDEIHDEASNEMDMVLE